MKVRRISIRTLVIASAAVLLFSAERAFAGIPQTVPEIDPGIATGGLALLAAAVLIVVERYRRR